MWMWNWILYKVHKKNNMHVWWINTDSLKKESLLAHFTHAYVTMLLRLLYLNFNCNTEILKVILTIFLSYLRTTQWFWRTKINSTVMYDSINNIVHFMHMYSNMNTNCVTSQCLLGFIWNGEERGTIIIESERQYIYFLETFNIFSFDNYMISCIVCNFDVT